MEYEIMQSIFNLSTIALVIILFVWNTFLTVKYDKLNKFLKDDMEQEEIMNGN